VKRVLLVVIDGWTPRLFGPLLEGGELPTFAALAARGWLTLDGVSIFPSITPAATAAIVTGGYPCNHGISGMSWWNPSTGDVSYFGDDVSTVLRRGPGDFMRDFLLRLNGDRLGAPTLFEIVERRGRRAGCINHLVFRGDREHQISNPWMLRLLPSIGRGPVVHGPSWLCLGDFVSDTGEDVDLSSSAGVFNRFGMNDEGTERFLMDVPDPSTLPDFTVAYFADYDFDSHDRGPEPALSTLRRLDERLARIFEHWGGLDRVLAEMSVVMTADHGHSVIGDGEDAGIELEPLLTGYACADPATGWQNGDELLVCPNMRTAEVFHRSGESRELQRVAERLLSDQRVDQVIWRDSEDEYTHFRVLTADRGALTFRRANRGEGVQDDYGAPWELSGDPRALDLTTTDGRVAYGAYPNALERIACGIDYPRVGRLFVTARPGYEFRMTGQSVHNGAGSHGTLHVEDSRVPIMVTPSGRWAAPGPAARIVDVTPICCELLDIPFRWRSGEARAT
jgi:hypothetical protein